jgi:hypothetical protein
MTPALRSWKLNWSANIARHAVAYTATNEMVKLAVNFRKGIVTP